MKITFLLMLLPFMIIHSQENNIDDSIFGTWVTAELDTIMIKEFNGEYKGILTGFSLHEEVPYEYILDEQNEIESLKRRPLLGISIFEKLQYNDKKWVGEIYLPESGSKYDCSLIVNEKDQLEVEVKIFLFSETDYLRRIK